MNKFLLIIFCVISIQISSFAQSLLHFDPKNCGSFIHNLSAVKVLDQRLDSGQIVGFVRDGKYNSKQNLLAQPSLSYLIEDYYRKLSSLTNKKSTTELLILVHKFSAKEDNTGYSEETARFFYEADYFISENGGLSYSLLGLVDEVVFVSSLEVTNKFLKAIDQSLCAFYENLYNKKLEPKARKYNNEEVLNFKEEQKKNFKAYSVDTFRNAYYDNWNDFLMLQSNPNETVVKKGNRFKVATTFLDGKVDFSSFPSSTKIIAFENHFYYRYDNRNYRIYKIDNDFYFIGYVPSTYWNNNGLIEKNMRYQLSISKPSRFIVEGDLPKKFYGYYEFKIVPRTGNIIPIRKVKNH